MRSREYSYRGVFRKKADHTLVGLDFYAENRSLALAHAGTIAWDEQLEIVKVTRLRPEEMFNAGSFFPVAS